MSYTNAVDAILKERLFGYGTPYRVEVGPDGVVRAVDTDAAREAEALSQLLANLPAQTAEAILAGSRQMGGRIRCPLAAVGLMPCRANISRCIFFVKLISMCSRTTGLIPSR